MSNKILCQISKLKQSRYELFYETQISTRELPRYSNWDGKKKNTDTFRWGNLEKAKRYWMYERGRKCSMCKMKEETQHTPNKCSWT